MTPHRITILSQTTNQPFQVGSSSDVDDGLGHGLGLIIDKLKNIETKLDELKTIDQVTKVFGLSPIYSSQFQRTKGRLP